ncbi:MAG: methylase [Acidobacteria bacterium]|nr:MAG: methylase [Acidobacteriota bacterium]
MTIAAGKKALRVFRDVEDLALRAAHRVRLEAYLRSDRRPWRAGYTEFRARHLGETLEDAGLMALFRDSRPLPPGYGFRLDARVVEIPWALSRLPAGPGALLDAGSSLNHAFVVGYCQGQGWKLHVLTLAPESRCFWDRGVSYVYGDLRRTVFADDAFGAVVCISTIEHVGMDNSFYAGAAPSARPGDAWEFLAAVKELKRVLEPGRALYITFPFGRHEDHGWFQQLDAGRVDRLVDAFGPVRASETVFRYLPGGWQLSDRAACAECEFFDVRKSRYFDRGSTVDYPPDYPAGERAVLCLELRK